MSVRSNDRCGRWRNRTVAFRASNEEVRDLDALVALSGLTKQDYIMRRSVAATSWWRPPRGC